MGRLLGQWFKVFRSGMTPALQAQEVKEGAEMWSMAQANPGQRSLMRMEWSSKKQWRYSRM